MLLTALPTILALLSTAGRRQRRGRAMNPVYIMLGGFLGAGKTTAVARLARHYQSQGKRVGIVTNDQATDLVDTQNLRAQGFDVGEVAGSCFCCNFSELTRTFERLHADALPDVILAEPVGSCTDLVATVIRPLTQVYRRPLDIAPYGVLLKPSHGKKILAGQTGRGGFSPQAEYIFRKQIEEADFVLINRIDQLSDGHVDELRELLATAYPETDVLCVSALTGQGFDELIELLARRGAFGQRKIDVDYDVYAAGEADLGWLNGQFDVSARDPFELDAFVTNLVGRLHQGLLAADAEAAHVKAIAMSDGHYAVANLVSSQTGPELSLPSEASTRAANIVINARVAADPTALESMTRAAVAEACRSISATSHCNSWQCFRPSRPVPTHRIAEP